MKELNNNLGIAWICNQQKPFLYTQKVIKGKQKGKLTGYLTRGRDNKVISLKVKKYI